MSDEEKKIRYMKEFRDQLVIFLDELIEQFPQEGDFVMIRIFIKDQLPMIDVLGRFIRDLLPLKDQITKRAESFFLENALLCAGPSLAGERIDHFRQLWLSDKLDATDRAIIWKWMDLFVSMADRYFRQFGHVPGWFPSSSSSPTTHCTNNKCDLSSNANEGIPTSLS